jgi:hypothetical protein
MGFLRVKKLELDKFQSIMFTADKFSITAVEYLKTSLKVDYHHVALLTCKRIVITRFQIRILNAFSEFFYL